MRACVNFVRNFPCSSPAKHAGNIGELYIRERYDENLFNLRRLKAKNKTQEQLIQELLFAGDLVLVIHSLETMKTLLTSFAEASKRFGLTINIRKTEVLIQDTPAERLQQREVFLNDSPLTEVDMFTYLGSMISNNGSIYMEQTNYIQSAAAAFGKLRERLWDQRWIHMKTKMNVYQAIVIPTLLYSCKIKSATLQGLLQLIDLINSGPFCFTSNSIYSIRYHVFIINHGLTLLYAFLKNQHKLASI